MSLIPDSASDSVQKQVITLPCIRNDGRDVSYFSERRIELLGDQARCLSEQIPALNFRFRSSPGCYKSGFHVAGDPTLLIILAGQIEITLASDESRRFGVGDLFVAEDFLADGVVFTHGVHGHKAEVIGANQLQALHLKLAKR